MQRSVLLCALEAGCSVRARENDGISAIAGASGVDRVVFEGGTAVARTDLTPTRMRPGEPLHIRLAVSGAAIHLRVSLRPPRDASRQVAQGGMDAPSIFALPDGRSRIVDVPHASGTIDVAFDVPEPWYAATAIVMVEGFAIGTERRLVATMGPRKATGEGFIALLDVEAQPSRTRAPRTTQRMTIDGVLDEPAWSLVPAATLVDSRDGERREQAESEVRFAWDDEYLFVGAHHVDSDIRSSFEHHDDPLWEQEAFELFVFGDASRERYLEYQLSPRGTTFDARFLTYRRADRSWTSAWRSRVAVEGTVGEEHDRDRGWWMEAAVPWSEICENTEVTCPPHLGMTLRINAFRLERPRGGDPLAVALSPPGVPDFHAPQRAAILGLFP